MSLLLGSSFDIFRIRLTFATSNYSGNRMAHHKSALKRIRNNEAKRQRNRYQHKTTRTYIRKLRATSDKKEAEEMLKTVSSMLDKLAKKNIIHKNKAANQKAKLTLFVNSMA